MKYFTDSPYERMMMEIPRPQKEPPKKAASSLKEKPSDKRASDPLKEKKERGVNVKGTSAKTDVPYLPNKSECVPVLEAVRISCDLFTA